MRKRLFFLPAQLLYPTAANCNRLLRFIPNTFDSLQDKSYPTYLTLLYPSSPIHRSNEIVLHQGEEIRPSVLIPLHLFLVFSLSPPSLASGVVILGIGGKTSRRTRLPMTPARSTAMFGLACMKAG